MTEEGMSEGEFCLLQIVLMGSEESKVPDYGYSKKIRLWSRAVIQDGSTNQEGESRGGLQASTTGDTEFKTFKDS